MTVDASQAFTPDPHAPGEEPPSGPGFVAPLLPQGKRLPDSAVVPLVQQFAKSITGGREFTPAETAHFMELFRRLESHSIAWNAKQAEPKKAK